MPIQNRTAKPAWSLQMAIPLVLLATMLVALVLLTAQSAHEGRTQLSDRFANRAGFGARFVETYNDELLMRERQLAAATLAGRSVTQTEFEHATDRFGFQGSVLLDKGGKLLAVTPYRADLIGRDMTVTYSHLAQAVSGRTAVSNVIPSAARGEPLVAYATPFDTPYGRRVMSGGFTVNATPLNAYLRNLAVLKGTKAYIVDDADTIIAASRSVPAFAKLARLDPSLSKALRRPGRTFVSGDVPTLFAAARVDGATWTLITTVPEAQLFAPVRGANSWVPWMMLAVLIGAVVVVGLLFVRSSRQRDELARTMQETERLNQALDHFSGRVAHDLRGPLGNVRMFADMAGEGDAETRERAVGALHRAADRGLELVEDLLGLAKASGTPRLETLYVEKVVDSAVEGIGDVRVSVDAGAPVVVADRVGLTQAIRNLVSNASRYGRNGDAASVTIQSRDDGDGWQISVSDEGPGLSQADAERIFEPFYRGGNGGVSGTGLGLAIVASFVESHGGRVWVDTTVPCGARFVMHLPKRSAGSS